MGYREEITNRIIEALKKGTAPWQKTWVGDSPFNAVTGYKYRGINSLILALAGVDFDSGSESKMGDFPTSTVERLASQGRF